MFLSDNARDRLRAIATRADIPPDTRAWHTAQILRKLGVEERNEAVEYLKKVAPQVLALIRATWPHHVAR